KYLDFKISFCYFLRVRNRSKHLNILLYIIILENILNVKKYEKVVWMIPIVANNRNRRCRPRGGAIVGVLIVAGVLGLIFFLFFNRFNRFIIPFWSIISGLGIFLIIIVGISSIASSMSQNYVKPKENIYKKQSNPYIYQDTIKKRLVGDQPENHRIEEVNYCRYCGSKIDRDAIFCHQCGSKI
ncbi:MAG: zinc-ribbon domain-containing protein, partial [Promethearchaeota archaeon]